MQASCPIIPIPVFLLPRPCLVIPHLTDRSRFRPRDPPSLNSQRITRFGTRHVLPLPDSVH